jgi:hypothetical protein
VGQLTLAQPVIQAPVWSFAAMLELVVPLAITVLVVQNGQGVAVLKNAGHEPPVNMIAVACGIGAAVSAVFGAVSTCLTGPTNGLLTSSGEKPRHYTGALMFGVLALLFGLMAPTFTGLMLAAPKEFIMVLGGLAMLRVLQGRVCGLVWRGQIFTRRIGQFAGHGGRHRLVQHRRGLLGLGGRVCGVVVDGAGRFPDPFVPDRRAASARAAAARQPRACRAPPPS